MGQTRFWASPRRCIEEPPPKNVHPEHIGLRPVVAALSVLRGVNLVRHPDLGGQPVRDRSVAKSR
jgi:hypothetical protein